MKKNFTLLFGLFLFGAGCETAHTASSGGGAAFTVGNASYEEWVSGVRNGGRGVEYYFPTVINTSKSVVFDSLYVSGKVYPLFVVKEGQPVNNDPVKYTAGDTITVRASYFTRGEEAAVASTPPVAYTGEAMLSYTIGGRTKYYTVSKLEQRPSVERP